MLGVQMCPPGANGRVQEGGYALKEDAAMQHKVNHPGNIMQSWRAVCGECLRDHSPCS